MSLRLRLFSLGLQLFVRPHLSRASEPEPMRRELERSARWVFRSPPFALYSPGTYDTPAGPHPALWVSSSRPDPTRVLLYIHGGGFIAGSPQTHRKMLARLARLSGLRIFAPDYRLAPEHPFPAGNDDCLAAWDALIAQGYAPADIAIGGDSAGGGLAMALLSHLCQAGTPPAACLLWSPFADMTLRSPSLTENAKTEQILPIERIDELLQMVLAGADPADPRASPLFARFPNCPPVLLQASDSEALYDDAVRAEAHLRAEGAETRLEVFARAPHVWQIFDGWFPEAREALANSARFLRAALRLPPPPTGGN